MMIIVPNFIRDSINEKLNIAFKEVPDAAKDRDYFYEELLNYYDEHGIIPDFNLTPNEKRKEDYL